MAELLSKHDFSHKAPTTYYIMFPFTVISIYSLVVKMHLSADAHLTVQRSGISVVTDIFWIDVHEVGKLWKIILKSGLEHKKYRISCLTEYRFFLASEFLGGMITVET